MNPKTFILKSEELEVTITNLGATLMSIVTKDNNQKPVDVLLGFDNPYGYLSEAYLSANPFLGAGVGRYGNRIANGEFTIDGEKYTLAKNNGNNHLHGGNSGFDQKLWDIKNSTDNSLELEYISPEGEEGYPGTLKVNVTFEVRDNELKITYQGEIDKPCYVNVIHHPYFNLDGSADIKQHQLKLYTNKYLKTSEDLIPDGSFIEAEGEYNFNNFQSLQPVIDKKGGLDDCYVFEENKKCKTMAELYSPKSGIALQISSDFPGIQVYTGNALDVEKAKNNKHYEKYAGVALEAQYLPDSPHHPEFPSTLLKPGEKYNKTVVYKFNRV